MFLQLFEGSLSYNFNNGYILKSRHIFQIVAKYYDTKVPQEHIYKKNLKFFFAFFFNLKNEQYLTTYQIVMTELNSRKTTFIIIITTSQLYFKTYLLRRNKIS